MTVHAQPFAHLPGVAYPDKPPRPGVPRGFKRVNGRNIRVAPYRPTLADRRLLAEHQAARKP